MGRVIIRRLRGVSDELQERAKGLRHDMTLAERCLWNALRGWDVPKFRRQHPLDRSILDFYCAAARLCIEVDGSVHNDTIQREKDQARTAALEARGIRVIRFRNDEVLNDTRAVLRKIKAELRGSVG